MWNIITSVCRENGKRGGLEMLNRDESIVDCLVEGCGSKIFRASRFNFTPENFQQPDLEGVYCSFCGCQRVIEVVEEAVLKPVVMGEIS